MTSGRNKKSGRAELEAELESFRRREALYIETEAFAHVGHFEWNFEDCCFETCSPGFAGIFGLSRETVLDRESGLSTILDRVRSEDRGRYKALLTSRGQGVSLDIEFRIMREGGGTRSLYQVGIESDGGTGSKSILPGILHDVTAQMESDSDRDYGEALALQAEQVAEIGNFLYDETEDRYIYSSPGCAQIYGMSEEEYEDVDSLEEDLSDIHELDRERIEQAYDHYYNTGEDCKVEFRIYRGDGEIRWIRELLVALELKQGKVALTRGVMQDITEQKNIELELRTARDNLETLVAARTEELAKTVEQLEEEIHERKKVSAELEFLANHDPLTGLPSLRLCKDRLERALAEARRNQHIVAVMFLDLDGFKAINDTYGHEYGDSVLKTTAARIKAEVRETDTVARIGGDEFLVILTALPELSVVERVAGNLIQQVAQPIAIEHAQVAVGTSIGIAIYPDDASDSEEMIRIADKAMYLVKHSGKNNFGFARSSLLN